MTYGFYSEAAVIVIGKLTVKLAWLSQEGMALDFG